jgi:hypothetical protein
LNQLLLVLILLSGLAAETNSYLHGRDAESSENSET